jgi:hypothetical protein
MRLNDWDWRREQEEACRLFDFGGRTVIDNWRPWYEATDKVAEYCDNDVIATKSLFDHFQAEYGAKALENKEDTKMDLNQLTNNKQTADVKRRNIMNKLKVGDKICTSINMTTPLEITAFDYKHYRIQVKSCHYEEGLETVRWFWIDPFTITDRTVRRVSYADYYAEKRKQKKIGYLPTPKRIIVNVDSKVTVVMWDDNTKTIVKCSEADQHDPYAAYCAAFAKKCYGTNSQLKKTIENHTVFQESKKKDKTAAPLLPSMEEAAKSFCDTAKKYFGTD